MYFNASAVAVAFVESTSTGKKSVSVVDLCVLAVVAIPASTALKLTPANPSFTLSTANRAPALPNIDASTSSVNNLPFL